MFHAMHFTDYLFMQSQSTLKCQILFGAVQYCTLIADVVRNLYRNINITKKMESMKRMNVYQTGRIWDLILLVYHNDCFYAGYEFSLIFLWLN